MNVSVRILGDEPGILQHSGEGALNKRSPANQEKSQLTAKRKKTEADELRILEIETKQSIWVDAAGRPTIPPHVLRATIHGASKLERRGQDVNRGLRMYPTVTFDIGTELNALSLDEIAGRVQHLANVRVGTSRVIRARALFFPWEAQFRVSVPPDVIDPDDLERWIEMAGERIGLGDWRPDKGGMFGMFQVGEFELEPEEDES